jgi:dTDP-4-dehydrorhamnose 3,5-epimerase
MNKCVQLVNTSELKFNPEMLNIVETKIPGLFVIERPYYGDERGGFQENYRTPDILKGGWGEVSVLQSAASDMCVGARKGIHCERQAKLITFNAGEFYVVELDLRGDSPTFGQHVVIKINVHTRTNPARDRISIVIPKGVGNSMQIIQPRINDTLADISYQVSEVYDKKEAERVVRMDDSQLGIKWPSGKIVQSKRDNEGYLFKDFIKKHGSDYIGIYNFDKTNG